MTKKQPSTKTSKALDEYLGKKALTLSRTTLFGVMNATSIKRLAELAEWRTLAAGTTICRKGDPGTHLFVVHSGQVKFGSGTAYEREVTLSLLGPGTVFGELAVADGGLRTADAFAVGPVELLALARRDLIPFFMSEPGVMLQMMTILAARARWISESYEDTVFLPLPKRLAKRLLLLSQLFGFDTKEGRKLAVSLPHSELASHMHVTRESINRLIQKWRRDGLIEERRGIVVIKDMQKLEALAMID